MNIADNILKYHLKNVYFIAGTACGGKTTICKTLAEKHGFIWFDADGAYPRHKAIADPIHQPAMCKKFASWEEYFYRPYQEYAAWLDQSNAEQVQMALFDLIELSKTQTVVTDLHIPVEMAAKITDPDRIVFLITDPKLVSRDYYKRPDHRPIYECIMSLSDPARAFENCSRTLEYINGDAFREVKASSYRWIERTDESTVAGTLAWVEEALGLKR